MQKICYIHNVYNHLLHVHGDNHGDKQEAIYTLEYREYWDRPCKIYVKYTANLFVRANKCDFYSPQLCFFKPINMLLA